MGLGHVPSGAVPRERQGDDLPRRQRRRAGAPRALDLTDRQSVGLAGESIARWFLSTRGLEIIACNQRVGRGEIDLVCVDGGRRVVVEVRARQTSGDPIDAIDRRKRRRVRGLARDIGISRVDLVGVGITGRGVDIHWIPDVDLS